MKIELHLIQNFAPSCLNRDDTNTPKDCEFGGIRRARISSQCIKRAIREYFKHNNLVEVGKRTLRLKKELQEKLSDFSKPDEEKNKVLDFFLSAFYSKMDSKKKEQTKVLLFIGKDEIETAVQCIKQYWEELFKSIPKETKKSATEENSEDENSSEEKDDKAKEKKLPQIIKEKITEALKKALIPPDIALFGRMLAEHPGTNVDAAVQVAQAISTNRLNMEMDFFTAVDDLTPREEPEAGMMGVVHYNSACFYRYLLIDTEQLVKNLNNDEKLAGETIEALLKAMVFAIPTGKQNSMAAQNPPSLGFFVMRDQGFPCSLANAFAEPVKPNKDLIGGSIEAMLNYWTKVKKVYGEEGILLETLFHIDAQAQVDKCQFTNKDANSVSKAVERVVETLNSKVGVKP